MSKGGPKTVSSLTKSQQGISNLIAEFLAPGVTGQQSPQAQQMLANSRISQGATPYQGNLVAPLVNQFSQVRNLISSNSPNKFASGSASAVSNLLAGGGAQALSPSATAKYFQQAVASPAYQDFQFNIAPKIRESFAAGGGTFNSRAGVEMSNALQNLNTNLTGGLAQAQLQNQQLGAQLGQSARIAGLGYAPQVSNQNLSSALLTEQALNPFQSQANALAQGQYQEFLRTAPENNPYLGQALGFVNSSQLGVYNKPDTLGSGIGLLAGLAMAPMTGGVSLLGSMLGGFGGGGGGLGVGANGQPNFFGGGR